MEEFDYYILNDMYNLSDINNIHYTDYIEENMKNILTLICIPLFASLFSIFVVSHCIYESPNKKNNSDNSDNSDNADNSDNSDNIDEYRLTEEEKYIYKYADQYEKLEDKELSKENLDKLKTSILDEETPQGLIKMFFDNDINCFCYYSDKSSISYKLLETVSRHYIIKNDCKIIYKDYILETIKKYIKETNKDVTKVNKILDNYNPDKSILDNKEDNKEDNKQDNKQDNIKNNTQTFHPSNIHKNLKNNKDNVYAKTKNKVNLNDPYIPEECNHYKRLGSIKDYYEELTKKEVEKAKQQNYKNISFKDFKRD